MLTAQVLESLVHKAIVKAQKAGALPRFEVPEVTVQPPRQADFGDLSTSVCMQMARLARMAPVKIAEIVSRYMKPTERIGEVTVVHPGFLNFTYSSQWLVEQVEAVNAAGEAWGRVDIGQGQRMQVEYGSANPVGPLHVGFGRNVILGDGIANVLAEAGYDVQREYYL
nr:arginine--tRNA ligase [Ardenticatenia bacterium]